jgi:lipid A 4'-phosphatase
MRRRAALVLLGAAALAGAIFLVRPGLDLDVARLMLGADGRFLLHGVGAFTLIHRAVQYLGPATVVFFAAAAAAHRYGRPIWGITPWQAIYVILVVAIGPGLLANTLLKDHSHRPRPGDTQDFGGNLVYAPPFDFTGGCERNCSFVAGDPGVGFAFLAPALLLPRRRRSAGVAGALVLGGAIGLMRMLQGGHYFSDVIFSCLLVAATALTMHWAMFGPDGGARTALGRRLSA